MSTNMEADPIEEANGTINTNRCIITQSRSGIDTIFLRRQRSIKKLAGYGTLLMFLCFLACILAISLGTPKAIAYINGQSASLDAFFTQVGGRYLWPLDCLCDVLVPQETLEGVLLQ